MDEMRNKLSQLRQKKPAHNQNVNTSHQRTILPPMKIKRKVLLVADSQGRHYGKILRESLDTKDFNTLCFLKLNAVFEDIAGGATDLSKDFYIMALSYCLLVQSMFCASNALRNYI